MMTQPPSPGEDIAGAERARSELLDVSQVAVMLNCSPRSVYRLTDAGKLPRPVRLGALVRWRTDELLAWIVDGCPAVRSASPRKLRKGGDR